MSGRQREREKEKLLISSYADSKSSWPVPAPMRRSVAPLKYCSWMHALMPRKSRVWQAHTKAHHIISHAQDAHKGKPPPFMLGFVNREGGERKESDERERKLYE